jgi:hypothetical protein
MTSAQRRPDPRRQALTDLADAVNELVRDRRHTEYLTERYKVERPGRKTTSRQRRRAVTTTLPSLLRALLDAAMPGAVVDDTGSSGGGGFESRPAVDLGAVHTLQTITAEANAWRRDLKLPPKPLGKLLPSFVSHPHDDEAQFRAGTVDDEQSLPPMRAKQDAHHVRGPGVGALLPLPHQMDRRPVRDSRCGDRREPDAGNDGRQVCVAVVSVPGTARPPRRRRRKAVHRPLRHPRRDNRMISCSSCGNSENEIIGYSAHDYIQFWICNGCGQTWNRWPVDHPYHSRAERLRQSYLATIPPPATTGGTRA